MTEESGPQLTSRDAWTAAGFVALAIVAQLLAWSAFDSAGGYWMRFIGGGGRSPAVPMWVIFGLSCCLTLVAITGIVGYIRLVVRFRSSHRIHEDPQD